MEFRIGSSFVGEEHPAYFIADIAANHDGDLARARKLIRMAAESGANAAKFQNFQASRIVSAHGFRTLVGQASHQASWKKPVVEVYLDASIPDEWTPVLKTECETAGIDYLSTPYDFDAIDLLEPYVCAYKIGSGDIDWVEALERIAQKGKPVILSSGASTIGDVQRAVHTILAANPHLILMQCNTNYTGNAENFDHVHLRVLHTYHVMFPQVVLGLSDHTPGLATVLGAVALGARVIEKHFTDDNARSGPDHGFSMNPTAWREMVDRTRELERALGSADKSIAGNELETVVVQRRCLRAARDILPGEVISREMIDVLRPATSGAMLPPEIPAVIGTRALVDIPAGKEIRWGDLGA